MRFQREQYQWPLTTQVFYNRQLLVWDLDWFGADYNDKRSLLSIPPEGPILGWHVRFHLHNFLKDISPVHPSHLTSLLWGVQARDALAEALLIWPIGQNKSLPSD